MHCQRDTNIFEGVALRSCDTMHCTECTRAQTTHTLSPSPSTQRTPWKGDGIVVRCLPELPELIEHKVRKVVVDVEASLHLHVRHAAFFDTVAYW